MRRSDGCCKQPLDTGGKIINTSANTDACQLENANNYQLLISISWVYSRQDITGLKSATKGV
jgi:hypothetical protein